MNTIIKIVSLSALVFIFQSTHADTYPDMVGKWSGNVRTVTAGTGKVARGGMEIGEVKLTLNIIHQDEEVFMGRSRNSQMGSDVPSTHVWGTIRSNGQEALFITNTGARGQVWFQSSDQFEFCVTGTNEDVVTAYCAELQKEK